MIPVLRLHEGHAHIVQRLHGAQDILVERSQASHIPLDDTIRTIKESCTEALNDAVALGNVSDPHATEKRAQELTGKAIALQQLKRFPSTLMVLLKQYERAINMCEHMSERYVQPKDVDLVWDPAEATPLTRGFELVASDEHQTQMLEKAVAAGRQDAKYTIALKKNDLQLLQMVAHAGSLDAQFSYGERTKSPYKLLYIRGAAEQGHVEAQNTLGVMYEQGRGGVAQSDVTAREWFEKAARQGHPDAQNTLGVMYEQGYGGVAQSDVTAREWHEEAARQGHPAAQNNLGVMYEQGRGGVAQSDVIARGWYEEAARQGDSLAQNSLGVMYEQGRGGVAQSDVIARGWYEEAARQDEPAAQNNLGVMYEQGRGGVAQSDVIARRWYKKAARQGDPAAQANLDAQLAKLLVADNDGERSYY